MDECKPLPMVPWPSSASAAAAATLPIAGFIRAPIDSVIFRWFGLGPTRASTSPSRG